MAPGNLVENSNSTGSNEVKSTYAVKSPLTATVDSTVDYYQPLELTGALDNYSTSQHTPTMETTIHDMNVHDILQSDDCDAKIRDLAILIARRGVCVFPKQDNLTIEDEKLLCRKLGSLTHRPRTSDLHIHPINQTELPDGSVDAALTTIARDAKKKLFIKQSGFGGHAHNKKKQSHVDGWHSDSSYENVPADFTLLHMKETPATGGDTLFASSYEMYDLLSEPFVQFLETRTATFMPPGHSPDNIVDPMWKEPRGSPANVGPELRASHNVIRTNPITGWKAVYAGGHHMEGMDGLGQDQSDMITHFLDGILVNNHQIQMRVKWDPETLVVWDNRACFHCATFDYTQAVKRSGNRICGCGEKPYLDPRSSGRRYALGLAK